MGKRRKNKTHNLVVFNDDQHEDCEGAVRQYKPLPDKLEKGAYESQQQFMRRLNRLVGSALGEAEIEQKYDVDFCPKTGPNEFEAVFKAGPRTISKRKQEKRKERDRKRKAKKNAKKQLNQNEFETIKKKVAFGDVVHAPPDLETMKAKFDQTIKKMKVKSRASNSFRVN